MMRVLWVQDAPEAPSGAEISAASVMAQAPEGVEITLCVNQDGIPDGAYNLIVVGNVVSFNADLARMLPSAPILKVVADMWPHGAPELRAYLLQRSARLLLRSPGQREMLERAFTISAPVSYLPGPVAVQAYRDAAAARTAPRERALLWVGSMHAWKGLDNALAYAEHVGRPLHAYGGGPLAMTLPPGVYKGPVAYRDMPALMAGYETIVHLPHEFDACPRVLLEAWAAGCEIVTNEMQGASYWIKEHPAEIADAGAAFWALAREVARE